MKEKSERVWEGFTVLCAFSFVKTDILFLTRDPLLAIFFFLLFSKLW